jgi:hypothetical protein
MVLPSAPATRWYLRNEARLGPSRLDVEAAVLYGGAPTAIHPTIVQRLARRVHDSSRSGTAGL